jgi:hypothetical protein
LSGARGSPLRRPPPAPLTPSLTKVPVVIFDEPSARNCAAVAAEGVTLPSSAWGWRVIRTATTDRVGKTCRTHPTYLGLLNGIALAESRAHCYFEAWIAVTDNPAVKEVLQTVSWREGEHGMAFAKRISELGYQLRDKEDAGEGHDGRVVGSARHREVPTSPGIGGTRSTPSPQLASSSSFKKWASRSRRRSVSPPPASARPSRGAHSPFASPKSCGTASRGRRRRGKPSSTPSHAPRTTSFAARSSGQR